MSSRRPSRRRRNAAITWWRTSAAAVLRHIGKLVGASALALSSAFFAALFSSHAVRAQDDNASTRHYLEELQQQATDIYTSYESQPQNKTTCDFVPAGPYNKRAWGCTTAPPEDQTSQRSVRTLALKTAASNSTSRLRDRNLAEVVDTAIWACSAPRPIRHDYIKEEDWNGRWPDETSMENNVAYLNRFDEPCRAAAENANAAIGAAIRAI